MVETNSSIKILVVEDDPIILDLLRLFVTSFGYGCVTARDGVEAVAALKAADKDQFDIIITDMMMPNMGGMELLKYTRAHHPNVEVIVVTGHPGTFSYVDVIKAGAIDFIAKPFSENELDAKLKRVLRERNIIRALERLSLSDSLTGLYNRRYFDEKLAEESQRAHRQGYSLFLALLDVDKFKLYNDTLGHQAGDKLLQSLGEVLLQCIRKSVDWAFRFGGDEFAIIIPQAEESQAVEIGNRILRRYRQLRLGSTALSIGLAPFHKQESRDLAQDISGLIARADAALYAAKHQGGNQVSLGADSSPAA